ncbi:hypothetical protein IQ259_08245 [Fortiea sp. LEGE XX443]|uniref:hypothetical protein n=1 Tax=Fortiea sp. LEGE XX443 TaxID=1828611 RepID=UPI00187EF972|nr:hypothetical protein [Fortiea sp. LEGE XX443]MBE9005028.1 hypothetical protein [Fortiea sp. LEGE XX443]
MSSAGKPLRTIDLKFMYGEISALFLPKFNFLGSGEKKDMADSQKRAIVFFAWGEKYISEVLNCIKVSHMPDYDKILITDQVSEVPKCELKVIRANFQINSLLRKTELIDFLPDNYNSYLFLDSDTIVISDIEMGFAKAELYGIAASPAPHYSLNHFWGFEKIMELEGVSCSSQLQYNTGVIFFSINVKKVLEVFRLWKELGIKYQNIFENDQPFFSLSMELLNFNPYTLSINYNYRGLGNLISGDVKIWHSHTEMPKNINQFDVAWPARRVVDGKVIFSEDNNMTQSQPKHKIKNILKRILNQPISE